MPVFSPADSREQELLALRTENQRLKRSLLQHTMEHAVLDDHMSPQLSAHMEQFFPKPLTPWYAFILFYGGNQSSTIPRIAPIDALSMALTESLSTFGQPFFFNISGVVACLINISAPKARAFPLDKEAISRQIQATLSAKFPVLHRELDVDHISISKILTMESGPRVLYRSARTASEHRCGSEHICTDYDYAPEAPSNGQQLSSLEQVFWQQIQQRGFYNAAKTLDQIINTSICSNSSLEKDLPTIFSRMELVIDSVVISDNSKPLHDQNLSKLLHRLSHSQTYQQMRENAFDILAPLEDQFYTPPNMRNQKLPQIENYIRKNYTNPNLCATFIAEEFRISTSYLSRIFKADMGIGLLEYLHQIRVDAAKTMLRSTYWTLDEIANHVGFSNRWVLMRVFKKITGTTPGTYRAMQRDSAQPCTAISASLHEY